MIVDLTRELIKTPPYPGDAPPKLSVEHSPAMGDCYTLQRLNMSLHAATHIDAPLHFIDGGADVASLPPELFFGDCLILPAAELETLAACPARLLLRGKPDMTPARVQKLLALGVRLLGTEQNSVGEPQNEAAPHVALLSRGVALLENLDLSAAPDGPCTLLAAPLLIAGGEAAPCRALAFYPEG